MPNWENAAQISTRHAARGGGAPSEDRARHLETTVKVSSNELIYREIFAQLDTLPFATGSRSAPLPPAPLNDLVRPHSVPGHGVSLGQRAITQLDGASLIEPGAVFELVEPSQVVAIHRVQFAHDRPDADCHHRRVVAEAEQGIPGPRRPDPLEVRAEHFVVMNVAPLERPIHEDANPIHAPMLAPALVRGNHGGDRILGRLWGDALTQSQFSRR